MLVRLRVDGRRREADVPPATSLLRLLRDGLGVRGPKDACEQGECGACSVWLDGEVVCSCLVLAAQADGREVRTVESLAEAGGLSPAQWGLIQAGAVQCGFCSPGVAVVVADLLSRDPDPDEATIREALAGNLCRCTGYQKIVDAVRLAAARGRHPAGTGVEAAAS
jgi:carbon-monoxide dehydrogenase small subunit